MLLELGTSWPGQKKPTSIQRAAVVTLGASPQSTAMQHSRNIADIAIDLQQVDGSRVVENFWFDESLSVTDRTKNVGVSNWLRLVW